MSFKLFGMTTILNGRLTPFGRRQRSVLYTSDFSNRCTGLLHSIVKPESENFIHSTVYRILSYTLKYPLCITRSLRQKHLINDLRHTGTRVVTSLRHKREILRILDFVCLLVYVFFSISSLIFLRKCFFTCLSRTVLKSQLVVLGVTLRKVYYIAHVFNIH